MNFRCWIKGDDEGFGSDVKLDGDARDAAQNACERWDASGSWSGDPIPDPIEVYVRNIETNELFSVDVCPSWEVSFWARAPKLVTEQS